MLRRFSFLHSPTAPPAAAAAPRKHSKVIIWGTFAAAPLPKRVVPTELRITNLPSKEEINSNWKFVAVAAGSRHIALLTEEGHIVLFGSNKHGQIGRDTSETIPENEPQFFDLDWQDPKSEAPTALACGTNYTIAYKRGDTRAVVVGFNNAGQLGLGHKEILDNRDGMPEWRPNASWYRPADDTSASSSSASSSSSSSSSAAAAAAIEHVECGYNHTFMFFRDGRVFSCGTNQWGELALGRGISDSPMCPVAVPFFQQHRSKSIGFRASCGNSFSMFLSPEGRVFGCGCASRGQLPFAAQEPTVVPVTRDSRPRLIRIGDVTAGGDHVVLVSKKKGEIFFSGSLPDVGVIDATGAMKEIQRGDAVAPFRCMKSHGSATVIVDGSGELWGLGSNTEGQLGDWQLPEKEAADAEKAAAEAKEKRQQENGDGDADENATSSPLGKEEEKKKPLFETPEGFGLVVMEPEANPFVSMGLDGKMRPENDAPTPLLAVKELKRIGGLKLRSKHSTDEETAAASGSSKKPVKKGSIEWRDRLAVGNGFGIMLDPDDEYECTSPDANEHLFMPPPVKPKQTREQQQAEQRRKLNFKW